MQCNSSTNYIPLIIHTKTADFLVIICYVVINFTVIIKENCAYIHTFILWILTWYTSRRWRLQDAAPIGSHTPPYWQVSAFPSAPDIARFYVDLQQNILVQSWVNKWVSVWVGLSSVTTYTGKYSEFLKINIWNYLLWNCFMSSHHSVFSHRT